MKPIFNVRILLLSKDGRLIYFTEKRNTLDFNKTINDVDYRIRKEGVYRREPWLYKAILDRVFNVNEYWVLFNEGEADPMVPSNPEVSPYELYMINNSTVMSKAVSEWLRSNPFSGKGAFIMIVLALIAGYILITYGGFKL